MLELGLLGLRHRLLGLGLLGLGLLGQGLPGLGLELLGLVLGLLGLGQGLLGLGLLGLFGLGLRLLGPILHAYLARTAWTKIACLSCWTAWTAGLLDCWTRTGWAWTAGLLGLCDISLSLSLSLFLSTHECIVCHISSMHAVVYWLKLHRGSAVSK